MFDSGHVTLEIGNVDQLFLDLRKVEQWMKHGPQLGRGHVQISLHELLKVDAMEYPRHAIFSVIRRRDRQLRIAEEAIAMEFFLEEAVLAKDAQTTGLEQVPGDLTILQWRLQLDIINVEMGKALVAEPQLVGSGRVDQHITVL